jgi:hypothetical protein
MRTAVRMDGVAYVGDKKAAEATVTSQIVPRKLSRPAEGNSAS